MALAVQLIGGGHFVMRLAKTPFKPSWLVVYLALAWAAAAPACSLNPQPLPPGETADGAAGVPAGDATTATGDDASFGGGTVGGEDAAYDAPSATTPGEGGSDAAAPGAGDASSADGGDGGYEDAPSDAPSDAVEEGG